MRMKGLKRPKEKKKESQVLMRLQRIKKMIPMQIILDKKANSVDKVKEQLTLDNSCSDKLYIRILKIFDISKRCLIQYLLYFI